ncbi:MAG: TonB family protein [Deltaproteobacteria bacterium]|nr:TonB family protein [Deltaproteobacteria bacterium]
MAWSPNRSNGKGPEIPPFLPGVSPLPLKGMLALSGVFHILLGFIALTVASSSRVPVRLEPVAVVSLVGGGEFPARAVETPAPPKVSPEASPEASPPARKESAPVKLPAREKSVEKAPAKKKAADAAAEGEFSTSKQRVPPDMSSVEERLRRMREARAEADSVREAVEGHRSEVAARDAVRSIGERVARRIEAPPGNAPGAGGFGGGSQGTVRVSPEILEYFRKLEERVRESWVLPEALVRNAGKLMVEVRIVIEKDGRVSDTRIEKGSGNVYFDDSVRRAIRKASPVPVPPERLRGGEDHYVVGFRFHGAGGEG